jgi:hypothetical protein
MRCSAVDPNTQEISKCRKVLRARQPVRLEAAHLAGAMRYLFAGIICRSRLVLGLLKRNTI